LQGMVGKAVGEVKGLAIGKMPPATATIDFET
jgi:hypothetical protein